MSRTSLYRSTNTLHVQTIRRRSQTIRCRHEISATLEQRTLIGLIASLVCVTDWCILRVGGFVTTVLKCLNIASGLSSIPDKSKKSYNDCKHTLYSD